MTDRGKKGLRGINIITGICGLTALGGAISLGMLEEKQAEKQQLRQADTRSDTRRDAERRAARMAEPAIADSTVQ
ncbi:hypothetical protein [Sphingomonas carotinifaciens]|uniref:Uncharacterized protein n=1 Tax=Sphingomonas carotinifaciens TaxID=1166323 RepID=A0A1G7FK23_9SPHN|nr:hypothetical protein [Sphingomonas carotinifaciens]MBB4086120.1 hypothetical protein [Sphingomonas carotinifaciens]MWC42446.1 hypothetical protein [Sphingomonas carotinifaciens]SDE76180.1 hypothetical protein SAMN05216557_101437 [Sphingomonas carotinifaciens]